MAIIDRARHGEPVPTELPAALIESAMAAAEPAPRKRSDKSKPQRPEPRVSNPDALGSLLDMAAPAEAEK